MKKKLKKLPLFKSEDEEREFWSTHDSADYVDWSKARLTVFLNLRPSKLIMEDYYDIVILPSEEVRNAAIAASRRIHERLGSDLVLGKRSFKPHISLYHVAVRQKNIAEMLKRLRALAAECTVGPLTVKTSQVVPMFSVSHPAWLQSLHESVLETMNFLRDRAFPNTWHHPMFHTPAAEQNYKRYGSPIIGKIFDPHITLTSLKDDRDSSETIRLVRVKPMRFTPTALTVCQIGTHHSCHRIVATIPFSV